MDGEIIVLGEHTDDILERLALVIKKHGTYTATFNTCTAQGVIQDSTTSSSNSMCASTTPSVAKDRLQGTLETSPSLITQRMKANRKKSIYLHKIHEHWMTSLLHTMGFEIFKMSNGRQSPL